MNAEERVRNFPSDADFSCGSPSPSGPPRSYFLKVNGEVGITYVGTQRLQEERAKRRLEDRVIHTSKKSVPHRTDRRIRKEELNKCAGDAGQVGLERAGRVKEEVKSPEGSRLTDPMIQVSSFSICQAHEGYMRHWFGDETMSGVKSQTEDIKRSGQASKTPSASR